MINDAFTWFRATFVAAIQAINFPISLGGYTFGLLDFMLITFLLGVVIRNFVHTAR